MVRFGSSANVNVLVSHENVNTLMICGEERTSCSLGLDMLNRLTINTSKTSAVLFLSRQMGVALNLFNGGVNIDLNVGTTKLNFWGYLLTKTCSGILT